MSNENRTNCVYNRIAVAGPRAALNAPSAGVRVVWQAFGALLRVGRKRKGRTEARPILCFRLLTGGPQSPDR